VVKDGPVVLSGPGAGSSIIRRWGQGHVFTGTNGQVHFVQGELPGAEIAEQLKDSKGNVRTKSRPQYEEWGLDKIVSVKEKGAKGDGHTVSSLVFITSQKNLFFRTIHVFFKKC
jgi:glucan 1,3-beta-glucosidase